MRIVFARDGDGCFGGRALLRQQRRGRQQCGDKSESHNWDHVGHLQRAGYQQAVEAVCLFGVSASAADNPQMAANDSQRPGTARLPVTWIK